MFGRRKKPETVPYDSSGKIPVIRSSICTGEQVVKNTASGRFEELMLIRDNRDFWESLCRYRVSPVAMRRCSAGESCRTPFRAGSRKRL